MGANPSSTKDTTIPPYKGGKIWPTSPNQTDLFYGVANQIDPYYTYNPECAHCNGDGCTGGHCSAFTEWEKCEDGGAAKMTNALDKIYVPQGADYTYKIQDCYCSNKPICSRPNLEQCFLGNNSEGFEPTLQVDWIDSKKIKCTYDLTKIDNFNQIKKYIDTFNPNPDDPNFYTLMSKFCSNQTDKCLDDPTTKQPIKSCSLITSNANTVETNQCRLWFEKLNDGNRDAFVNTYCTNRQTQEECKCYNRDNDPTFITLNKILSVTNTPGACIYVPCKRTTPAFLVNATDKNTKCVSNVCQIVYNTTQDNQVIISNNKESLACNFPPPTPVTPPTPPKPIIPVDVPSVDWTPITPSVSPHQKVEKDNFLIYIGIFLILIFIILIILIILKSIKKNN